MIRLVALGSAIALLGAAVTFLYMGVLRYRGRAIPRATLRVASGLLGAGHGIAFLFFPDPVWIAPLLLLPTLVTYDLLRRGHRVAAGALLIALGLIGAVWWGYYLIEDALDPIISYQSVLWLWWAPEVLLIVAGVLLLVSGDRTIPQRTLVPQAAAHVRDPAPIGTAILRATLVGPVPIQILVGVGTAVLVVTSVLPLAVQAGVPWPVGLVAGSLIFAVIGVELSYFAIPRRVRRAWQAHAVVAGPETKRWLATTGTRVPASLPAMRRWLAQNPERPETRWARAQILIITGDLTEARAVIERMPIPTDFDRFDQETLRVYLDWVEGADPDYDALQERADTIGDAGSIERLAARGEARIAVARELAASGGDWMAPLIAVSDEAGPLADQVLRSDLRRAGYPWYLPFGLIISGLTLWTSSLLFG